MTFLLDSIIQVHGLNVLTRKESRLATQIVVKSLNFGQESRGSGNLYLASRVPHIANGTSSFQLYRIILSGDIHTNPGPNNSRKTPKYPCKECGRNVRSNKDVLLCAECPMWSHAKWLGLTKIDFKYYLDYPDIDWLCSWCNLPFRKGKYSFETELSIEVNKYSTNSTMKTSDVQSGNANHEHLPNSQVSSIVEERKNNSNGAIVAHLNINSIQNKFEQLKL